MKLLRIFVAVTLLFSVSMAQKKKETKAETKTKNEVQLKSQVDSVSYAIGQNISMQLKSLDLNMDLIAKSIKDGAANKSVLEQDIWSSRLIFLLCTQL